MEGQGDAIEGLHDVLVNLDLPSSLERIKNPTEDFLHQVITEFLKRYHINVPEIMRLIPEQTNALELTNPENALMAPIINLSEVIRSIAPEIFVKDFTFEDMIHPRPNRNRRILKFMANFMVYALNKNAQMQQRIGEVLSRGENLQDVRKEKQEYIETMNKQARMTAERKAEMERLEQEIGKKEAVYAQSRSKVAHWEQNAKEKEQVKTQKIAKTHANQAELQKRRAISEDLNGKIVTDPEEMEQKLQEKQEERKNQDHKRETILASILQKKTLIHNYASSVAIMKKEDTKLREVIEDQKKLKVAKSENEKVGEEAKEAMRTIALKEDLGNQGELQVAAGAIQECERQGQERNQKLRKTLMEMDGEKKLLMRKKENLETRGAELTAEAGKIQEKIGETESEITRFLRAVQELHDSEMSDIQKLHGVMLPVE